MLKLSNFPALWAEGVLWKPVACLSPRMGQCSYFLLLQSLITLLATFADMTRVGWGRISGCEEPDVVNWSAVSFPSILCVLEPIPFGSCYVLTVLPGAYGSLRLICSVSGNCQGPLWLLDCWKEYRYSACVSHFHILPYTCLNGIFFGLEYCGVEPKVEVVPPSQKPHLYTQAPVPFLVLGLSLYSTRPPVISGLRLHAHLSGNLTVNGLW